MSEKQTSTLYRIENPSHPEPQEPNGVVSHEELVGQWFTTDLGASLDYLRKNTQTFGKDTRPVDGTQLVIAQVPTEQLDEMHVSKHPIASEMDVEGDNYIVPRDGSVPTQVVPLDAILGELRGNLGNFKRLSEAKQRVFSALGYIAVEK